MEQTLAVNAENSRARVQNVGGDSSGILLHDLRVPLAQHLRYPFIDYASWLQMTGLRAAGKWTLDLSSPDMSPVFKNQQIQDILFVITDAGRTPDWPR